MSYSDHEHRLGSSMPDLPDDPYGRDTDLYPPVPEFPRYDFWDESPLEATFPVEANPQDLVVGDRYHEIPSLGYARRDEGSSEPERRPRSIQRLDIISDMPDVQQPVRRRYNPARDRRIPRGRQADDVTTTSLRADAAVADVVTGVRTRRQAPPRASRARSGNPAWRWSPITMPSMRQMLEQAFPMLVMAMSLLFALFVIDRMQMLETLWAPIVLAPSVLIVLASDSQIRPMWGRFAMINLITVGVFYPLIIVRQSYLRVPFVEWGNGTLTMPLLSTFTVIVILTALALTAGYMSRDDPEYAGILILPATLLVPFFAGATEIISLRTALIIAAGVFLVAGFLTVVASMLPGNYPVLVAPIALALEFFVLPLSDSAPIFPLGAGAASKFLFFVLLATTVGLTVAMPNIASWVRQIRDIVNAEIAHSRAR